MFCWCAYLQFTRQKSYEFFCCTIFYNLSYVNSLILSGKSSEDIDKIKKTFEINSNDITLEKVLHFDNLSNELPINIKTYQGLNKFSIVFLKLFLNSIYKKVEIFGNYIDDYSYMLEDLADQLCLKITKLAYRVLIYEMNLHRENNKFSTNDKELQYEEYCNLLESSNYVQIILEKYPVLEKIISSLIERYEDYIVEILSSFKEDREQLFKMNLLQSGSKINKMKFGEGDTHNNGKTVTKVECTDGEVVYYKPRNLNIDTFFSDFVELLSFDNNLALYTPRTFSRDNHGWVENISYEEVAQKEELEVFYLKLGVLLSYIYSLNGVDIHSENIIARGTEPILVDCESLFHSSGNREFSNATDYLNNILNQSVLSTGILPFLFGNGKVDISALSDQQDTMTTMKVPSIKNVKKSNMKVIREYLKFEKINTNNPENKELFLINCKIKCNKKTHSSSIV